jgi:subtilisin family serine protease
LSLQSLHETIIPSIHRIGRYVNSTEIIDLGNKSFGVAILDTGIDPHSDLNLVDSVSCINSDEHGGKCVPDNTGDLCGHGTHIAGIIGAKNNGNGIIGIAPNIKIYSIKVMGCGIGDTQDVQAGIEYILSKNDNIKVVNLSFGCIENPFTQCKSSTTTVIDNTINGATEKGITFVVAAGNGDEQHQPIDALHFWPAYNPNVITVAAITDTDGKCGGKGVGVEVKLAGGEDIRIEKDDTYADFSNYGPVITMAAPGVGINSTYLHNSYKIDSGTSMAAPFVSGAAAVYLASHPLASPVEVRTELLKSASNSAVSCIYPPGDDRGYFNSTSSQTNVPLLNLENMR